MSESLRRRQRATGDLRVARTSEPECGTTTAATPDGFEPSIIRDNLEFTKDYAGDLAHVAVVTDDSPWSKLAAMTGTPLGQLLGIDVDRFDDRVEAWKWLTSEPGG